MWHHSLVRLNLTHFWGVQPNFRLNFWIKTGRVGPHHPKMSPIRLSWPQKGCKFGFNPIMYLKHPIWTQPNLFLSRVGSSGIKFGLSCVGLALRVKIQVKFGLGWSGLFDCTTMHNLALFSQSAYHVWVRVVLAGTTEPQPCQRRDQMVGPIV